MIIPELNGKKGEIIVAKNGRCGLYGVLKRVGSQRNEKIHLSIDIYETFIIDKDYNIKKVNFYFNNYQDRHITKIKVAKGFEIEEDSSIYQKFDFV